MKQQPPPSYQVAMSNNTGTASETNAIANTVVALPPEIPLSPPPYNVTDNDNETVTDTHNVVAVEPAAVPGASSASAIASGSNAAVISHNN